jgi:pyruvate dehydrogenase E2 component (dihydrolipoamide acetyltransferase)
VILDSEENGKKMDTPQYQFTEVGGLRVRYADRGFGDSVVLLLHGFGGDLGNWMFNLDSLAEKHRVLALDLPGHGQSVKTNVDPSLSGMATFVSKFLDVLSVSTVNVVGHSMGGAIAMQLASDSPETVRSLGLICSAGLGPDINSDYLRGFVEAQTHQELKLVLQQLFADESLVNLQLVNDILNYKRIDGVEATLNALSKTLISAGEQTFLTDNIVASGIPVLVIWGKQDRIIPVSHAQNYSAAGGSCVEVEIFDSAGHMVQMEKAHDVNRSLLNFLA